MGDKNDLHSALMRAKFGVSPWFDVLPKDAKVEAEMALDRLIEVANREIEQAYFDGANNRSASVRAQKHMAPLSNGK